MKKSCFIVFILISVFLSGNVFSQQKNEQKKKPLKPALLVIDIQNAFLPSIPERDKEVGLYMINYAIDLFRSYGYPVIRIYHTDLQSGPKPGTDSFEYPSTVKILKDDPKIIKNYPNGFKKTDLDKILKSYGCNTVFLCGLSAVGCVISTYFGARDLDYQAFLVKDGIMSHNSTYTKSIEDIFNALGDEAIEVMLNSAEKSGITK